MRVASWGRDTYRLTLGLALVAGIVAVIFLAVAGAAPATAAGAEDDVGAPRAYVWGVRLHAGATCFVLPSLAIVSTMAWGMPHGVWDLSDFAGDRAGEQVALFGPRGAHVYRPDYLHDGVARVPDATLGVFSPTGDRIACAGGGRLQLYPLPEPVYSGPCKDLAPSAGVELPRAARLLWPPGTNAVVAFGTASPSRGCEVFRLAGGELRNVLHLPQAAAVAASADGHLLVVSVAADDPRRISVGWATLGPEASVQKLPVQPAQVPLWAAVTGDTAVLGSGLEIEGQREWGTRVTGYDRRTGGKRWSLELWTRLWLQPQELLDGYAVGELSSSGPREHHPEAVVLDCRGTWPTIVAQSLMTDLE